MNADQSMYAAERAYRRMLNGDSTTHISDADRAALAAAHDKRQRAAVKSKRRTEPSKEVVAAFVHNQVGVVDDQAGAVRVEGVSEESKIEDDPPNESGP